jgi:hypothetical protein
MTKRQRYCKLAILLALAACATAKPGTQSVVSISVRNDLIPPANVEIYLVPAGGIERLIGTVTSGDHSLRYTGLAPKGDYYLIARAPSGRFMRSSVLAMDDVTGLAWTLSSNLLRVTATREGG